MTLLEQLQSHKGGLLRLKTELYWYGSRGWDGSPDRICLLLDAATATAETATRARRTRAAAVSAAAVRSSTAATTVAAALLLIDGSPHWVWVVEQDVELL